MWLGGGGVGGTESWKITPIRDAGHCSRALGTVAGREKPGQIAAQRPNQSALGINPPKTPSRDSDVPELSLQNLARGSLRQLGDDLDDSGVFVGGQAFLAECL
jgi:hypothetical protein